MAWPLSQTLIRTATSAPSSHFSSTIKPKIFHRHLFTLLDVNSHVELSQAEAMVVKKIEDAIHTIIVKRSRPDWLPFVPRASYWVPPRRHSYGVAKIIHQLSNALAEVEFNSLTTFQGWPSSAFYLSHDSSSHLADETGSSSKEEC